MPAHRKLHGLGASDDHQSATLTELNSLISDAALDDSSSPRTPTSHATSHQNGGADEMSVAGLSGLLADAQTPLSHAASHATAGADPVSPASIGASPNPHGIEGGNHDWGAILNSQLIGKDGAGTVLGLPYSKAATGDNIAQREADGRLKAAAPTENSDLATKQYVDDGISTGTIVQDPVESYKVVGNADGGGAPPGANAGEAHIVNNWGAGNYGNTGTPYTNGDLAYWDGSTWNRVQEDVYGSATRMTIIGPVGSGVAQGDFAGKETQIATTVGDGTATFTYETPSDGWQTVIENAEAYKSYGIVSYNATTQNWHLSQAATPSHNSTTGIQGGELAADEAYHLSLSEHTTVLEHLGQVDHLGLQLSSTDPSGVPTTAELAASWNGEDWGIVIGSLGGVFVCWLNAAKDQGYGIDMGALL